MATLAAILAAALFFVLFALIGRSAFSVGLFLLRHHRGFHMIVTGKLVFMPMVVVGVVFAARRRAGSRQIRATPPRNRAYSLNL